MNQHLPVLLVVVPLVAAPIAALLNRPRLSWAVAVGATLWALYAALELLSQTMVSGAIHYELGGWTAPACCRPYPHTRRGGESPR